MPEGAAITSLVGRGGRMYFLFMPTVARGKDNVPVPNLNSTALLLVMGKYYALVTY